LTSHNDFLTSHVRLEKRSACLTDIQSRKLAYIGLSASAHARWHRMETQAEFSTRLTPESLGGNGQQCAGVPPEADESPVRGFFTRAASIGTGTEKPSRNRPDIGELATPTGAFCPMTSNDRLQPLSDDELLSRDDIERETSGGITRRWLELATHRGNGPPMLKISRRMVRYRRREFIAWLETHRVNTSDTGA
jgi:hypothetical protein